MNETKFDAKHIITRGSIAVMQIAVMETELGGQPFDFELPLSRLPEGAERQEVEIIIRRKEK